MNKFTIMISYYNSGYINFRKRKIGIVFSGETAEHIMDNFLQQPTTHPLKHIRIQQLAKLVNEWQKEGTKTYSGIVTDHKNNLNFRIIADVYANFVIITTCYKF